MTRVDKPVMQCDRCKVTTDDLHEMGGYQEVTHYHQNGRDKWDLCPICWKAFREWVGA